MLDREHASHVVRATSAITYYEYVKKMMSKRQLQVFETIETANNRYIMLNIRYPTDREIAMYLGYKDPNSVRPRRYELMKWNLIEEAGKSKCSVSGKLALTWKVKRLERLFDVKDNEDTLIQIKYLPPNDWNKLRVKMEKDGYTYKGKCVWKRRKSLDREGIKNE